MAHRNHKQHAHAYHKRHCAVCRRTRTDAGPGRYCPGCRRALDGMKDGQDERVAAHMQRVQAVLGK